jgi:dethiobiotin synthase
MPSRFFVTGTDTGVGKTVASALLCAALDAFYWKPIQTGSSEGTDRATVMRMADLPPGRTIRETYCFAPAVSPHLAARRAGTRVELKKIKLPGLPRGTNLIVEGAGGVLVPINDRQLMTHVMKRLNLPVLVVARSSLGTINHTTLSLAALRAAEIDIRGVIMVGKPNPENLRAIEHYGRVAVVGTIPVLPRVDRRTLMQTFRKHFDHRAFTQ